MTEGRTAVEAVLEESRLDDGYRFFIHVEGAYHEYLLRGLVAYLRQARLYPFTDGRIYSMVTQRYETLDVISDEQILSEYARVLLIDRAHDIEVQYAKKKR